MGIGQLRISVEQYRCSVCGLEFGERGTDPEEGSPPRYAAYVCDHPSG